MPPKKVCPSSIAEIPEAARQATTFNSFRSAMSGLGCSSGQVGAFWKQVSGAPASALKKRSADEAQVESPSTKRGVAVKKASPKAASPAAKTPKKQTPTRTPRTTIKKASPQKSPKASPKASMFETAAFAMACYADGVDWSKCLDDEQHGEKCAKSLRKKFPDLFDCPSCNRKQTAADAVKATPGAPPPPPPPPPPMPKKALAAITETTKEFTGASSLVSDKKGIVGMLSGVKLKKVDPAAPLPAFQAMPIVAADGSIQKALANAPNASASERNKLGQVSTATNLLSEMLSKQGTLRKTTGPVKIAKKDAYADNPLMAALMSRMGSIREALNPSEV